MPITTRKSSDIPWDELERIFVTQTGPRIGYREFAAMTADMAVTGRQEIHYVLIKDYAKEQRWWSKRAEHLREHNPGLYEDAEIVYGTVMKRLIEEGDVMAARDLSTLVGQLVKLQDLILTHRPEGEEETEVERYTKDDILKIAAEITPLSREDLLRRAAESLLDEDPDDEDES